MSGQFDDAKSSKSESSSIDSENDAKDDDFLPEEVTTIKEASIVASQAKIS